MSDRILVRGELSRWTTTGRYLFALAAIVGVVLALTAGPWGWLIAAGGGAIWLVLEWVAWQARRVRTWLTLHEDGIEIEYRGGYRAFHDSQVTAVALETKKNLNNGELSSVTRKFRIWADDSSEPVQMENKIKVGHSDPLAVLIERLLERLRGRMEHDLAQGGTASGDGWHLSRTALTLGRPPNDQQIPLSEVTAVETFDGKMCIWQRGRDLATTKLPLSGRNVYLLPALVRPYLQPRAEGDAATASLTGLGRVLFERRSNRSTVLAVGIIGVAMTIIGAALLASAAGPNGDEGAFVAAIVLLIVGPLVGALGFWLGFSSFRCHERGVWKMTPLGQKTLRYVDVGSFLFSSVRHYHNGAYTGTQLTMQFRPISTDRGPIVRYSARTKGDDDDLDGLRDYISRTIAARMAEQLRGGRSVAWTTNLEFTPEGIRYRPSGFLGRKEAQLLPYENYGGYELKQGTFRLLSRGNKKSLASEQAAAENFYPGFFLLLKLLHEPAAEEATA